MVKQNNIFIISIFIVVVLGILFSTNLFAKDMPALGISGYYDSSGNKISGSLSVVGGVDGVNFVTFEINAENLDTVPLDFKIVDATPGDFLNQLDTSIILTADPNSVASWESGLVDITGFEGTSPTFSVTIEGSSNARKTSSRTSEITFSVEENPGANFAVVIQSPSPSSAFFQPVLDDSFFIVVTNEEGQVTYVGGNRETLGMGDIVNLGAVLFTANGMNLPFGGVMVGEFNDEVLDTRGEIAEGLAINLGGIRTNLPSEHALSGGRTKAIAYDVRSFTAEETVEGTIIIGASLTREPILGDDVKLTLYAKGVDGTIDSNSGVSTTIFEFD